MHDPAQPDLLAEKPLSPPPQTWKLTLCYDGTDFHGWQIQPGAITVQGELQNALGRITGEAPLPQGSGRTDAGVHALAQVASFPLAARIPAESLMRALNRILPRSVRILDATVMPDSFHARHSVVAKTYEYRISPGDPHRCSPFLARYVYACPWILDQTALNESAAHFLGEHDFLSFAAFDPDLNTRSAGDAPSTIRTIFSSTWEQRSTEGDLLVYSIRGNGFLHHMVRNIVGTMIDAARGQITPDDIPGILAARSRSAAGPTAPARGLFLHSVEYP